MAATARYHRLPEDNRPSMNSERGDDDNNIYDSDPLVSFGNSQKKGERTLSFTYHPTLFARILVATLLAVALILFLCSRHRGFITAEVFICIAIARNASVLTHHVLGRLIRIHIEIVGSNRPATTTGSPSRRSDALKWLRLRRSQLLIDSTLVIALLVSVVLAFKSGEHYYRWDYVEPSIPGCVFCWIAIPLYAFSIIDVGTPSRFAVTSSFSIDLSKEKDGREEFVAPHAYRDVDVETATAPNLLSSGAKTGRDSPTQII